MAEIQQWTVQCRECKASVEYNCNTCDSKLCSDCKEKHQASEQYKHHKIVKYSENTNKERMAANLQVLDLDLSKMAILAKDHKRWSFDSGLPVPFRLVVSGRSTINNHLSELMSEIIEPLALESDEAEIQSSLRRY